MMSGRDVYKSRLCMQGCVYKKNRHAANMKAGRVVQASVII
jgi:hypothetical protein